MGTYAEVSERISHNVLSNPAVIEELHSVKGLGVHSSFIHQLMMFYEYDFSVCNHHMQQVPVIKHSEVLALLFCTSERSALTEFLMAHLFDKLLSCRRATMGPHGPKVAADNLADSHASDVATNMKNGSSSTPEPLLHINVLVT